MLTGSQSNSLTSSIFSQQTPQFDRWSGNSHGRAESLKFSHSSSGCGTHNLQLPIHEDNPLSPGYTEPLCVSHLYILELIKQSNHANNTIFVVGVSYILQKKKLCLSLVELSSSTFLFQS